jgi:hypothetical protein
MANQIVHEENLAHKGRTGSMTKNRRKKRGMKSRMGGKGVIPPGIPTPQTPRADRDPVRLLDWGHEHN